MSDTQMLNPRQARIYRTARTTGKEWAASGKPYDTRVARNVVEGALSLALRTRLSDEEVSWAVDLMRDGYQTYTKPVVWEV